MNLVITGHGLDITPSINDYVRQKLIRVLRHSNNIVDVKFLLDVNQSAAKEQRHTAQCIVHVKGGELVAKVARADMYVSIDAVMDRMDEKLNRQREKKRSQSASKSVSIALNKAGNVLGTFQPAPRQI